ERSAILCRTDTDPIIAWFARRIVIDRVSFTATGRRLPFRASIRTKHFELECSVGHRPPFFSSGAICQDDLLRRRDISRFGKHPHRLVLVELLPREPEHDLTPEPLVLDFMTRGVPQIGRVASERHNSSRPHLLSDEQRYTVFRLGEHFDKPSSARR